MAKYIKEFAIILGACLIGMLVCAGGLYQFLPARKEVPEIVKYQPSNEIQEALADNIDTQDENVILTFEQGEYEVTSRDLNTYKNENIYIPGKSNPFAAASSDVTGNYIDKNSTTGKWNTGNSSKGENNTNTGSEYIRNNGTK